jgi:hypothetical protein
LCDKPLKNQHNKKVYGHTPTGLFLLGGAPKEHKNPESVEVTFNNRVANVAGVSVNGVTINFRGFTKTYKILSNYDQLIARALYTVQSEGDRSIKYVPGKCLQIAIEGRSQVARRATHNYNSNPQQTGFNVWRFMKANMRYATVKNEQLPS